MTFKPSIHVIDTDPSTRTSLSDLIRSAGMQEYQHGSGREFLDCWERTLPGCVVLEVQLPDMSGLELQARLARERYHAPLIFLTAHGDVPTAVQAMRAGAIDFLPKPVEPDRLADDMRRAVDLDMTWRRTYERRATVRARLELLTRREQQVLEGVVAGRSNKEIARDLGISHKTVELHRSNMMAKLHAESIAELVRLAIDGAGERIDQVDGAEAEAAEPQAAAIGQRAGRGAIRPAI